MKNRYEIQGDTTIIYIKKNHGRVIKTIIDTCDLETAMLLPGHWTTSYSFKTKSHYVIGWMRPYKDREKGMTVTLSRFLFGDVPSDLVVDHINHDTVDNRRSLNLRVVTEKVNRHNRKPKPAGKKKVS